MAHAVRFRQQSQTDFVKSFRALLKNWDGEILKMDIHKTSSAELMKVIESRSPCGLFLARNGTGWAAVDNSTGDAWTELFRTKWGAVRWLRRKGRA